MVLRGTGRKARVDDCKRSGPERHLREVECCHVIRCVRYIPLRVKRVDEEGVVLWPCMIIVLNEGEFGSPEAAKVVNSSGRIFPKHFLEEFSS